MKTPLVILLITGSILGFFWLLAPEPDPGLLEPRTDLPWQIKVDPDGSSHVFDLHLGEARLSDATAKFGNLEDIAVFQKSEQSSDLEAYFGDVMFGPLKAKLVVKLAATDAEKAKLMRSARDRKGSPTGDWKYLLSAEDATKQFARKLTAISYIPATRSLDADFFLQRFGQPASRLTENEEVESWFYPQKGLSIVIDESGKEILEYVAPRNFVAPIMKSLDEQATE